MPKIKKQWEVRYFVTAVVSVPIYKASFHFIVGYREEKFNCRDFFWSYVQALVGSGYRFQ